MRITREVQCSGSQMEKLFQGGCDQPYQIVLIEGRRKIENCPKNLINYGLEPRKVK